MDDVSQIGTNFKLKIQTKILIIFLDISNADYVQLQDAGNGLHFGRFFGDQGADGVMKIIPGGFKKRSRSKKSSTVRVCNCRKHIDSVIIFFSL